MSLVRVTGAGRGIGRALAAAYAAAGWDVVGTVRDLGSAPDLGQKVRWVTLDVDRPKSIASLPEATGGEPIDLLINNAGIIGTRETRPGAIDYAVWTATLVTNLFGPMRVTEALLPQLRAGRGRKVATISSRRGSIASNTSGGSYVYRSSKAAVNAAMHSLALDLRPEGFTVVVLHPGWVRTDMGGGGADIDAATSAAGLIRVIDRLGAADTGTFWNHDGTAVPW